MDHFYSEKGELRFNLTYDIPFKFMFAQKGETEDLLARFLNYVLDLKGADRIIELVYNNIELPESHIGGRRLVLDLKVTDQRGKTYNANFSVKTMLRFSSELYINTAVSPVSNYSKGIALIRLSPFL